MYKKRLRTKNHFLEENLINLTPLIDVVFVVLTVFILIAPLVEVDNVDLAVSSESSTTELSQKKEFSIVVREDSSIWVDNKLITSRELLSVLKDKKRKNPSYIPQLYHDKKACFGTYQEIKAESERAGFKRLDVILQGG
jgi:biopolymer transport protein ExbD